MKCAVVFREETLAYKTEAADLQRQLRELQSQFDMLSGQASTLTQGRRARVGATSVVSGHLATIEESLSGRNLQVLHQSLNNHMLRTNECSLSCFSCRGDELLL